MSDFSNISLIECNSSNSYENNSQELASFNKSLFPYNSLIASEQSNNLELEESFNCENENQNINENSHSNNIFSNQDNIINNESNSSNNKTSISFLQRLSKICLTFWRVQPIVSASSLAVGSSSG